MEHTNQQEHYGPPLMDVVISALGALVIGGLVWAGGYGTVAALNYAGEAFGIYPPASGLINNATQFGYVAVPILAGLAATWISYRFLLKLD